MLDFSHSRAPHFSELAGDKLRGGATANVLEARPLPLRAPVSDTLVTRVRRNSQCLLDPGYSQRGTRRDGTDRPRRRRTVESWHSRAKGPHRASWRRARGTARWFCGLRRRCTSASDRAPKAGYHDSSRPPVCRAASSLRPALLPLSEVPSRAIAPPPVVGALVPARPAPIPPPTPCVPG